MYGELYFTEIYMSYMLVFLEMVDLLEVLWLLAVFCLLKDVCVLGFLDLLEVLDLLERLYFACLILERLDLLEVPGLHEILGSLEMFDLPEVLRLLGDAFITR